MKLNYETAYRPNYEAYAAFVWIGVTALFIVASTTLIRMPFQHVVFCTVVLLAMFFARTFQALRLRRARASLNHTPLTYIQLPKLKKRMRKGNLFLGRGFDWASRHAQAVADLMAQDDMMDMIRRRGQGGTWLHGVGNAADEDLFITDAESMGHVFIIGTTGSGKTRLFDLLITQCILRSEPTIILDPKGDKELCDNALRAFSHVNDVASFVYFHPGHPDATHAIDPLANFSRPSELATRIANVIPTSDTEVFKAYSQMAVAAVLYGTLIGRKSPTIADMIEPLTSGVDGLVASAIFAWCSDHLPRDVMIGFPKLQGLDRTTAAERAVNFYRDHLDLAQNAKDVDLENLIGLFAHNREHFSKMIASLIPVLSQLSSAPLDRLLSARPDRLPATGRIVDMARVIESNGCAYIGLDTLSDSIVGRSIGQLILSDLAAIAGARYNYAEELDKMPFVNLFIDECSEVVNENLIQILNKGRGSRFRVFIATQTLADFEARMGDAAMMEMITGNLNSVIMLRSLKPDVQKTLTDTMPETRIHYIMQTNSVNIGEDNVNAEFGTNAGERLMFELQPIITPQSLGDLPDLEFFSKSPSGRIVKGKLPILVGDSTLSAREVFMPDLNAKITATRTQAGPRATTPDDTVDSDLHAA